MAAIPTPAPSLGDVGRALGAEVETSLAGLRDGEPAHVVRVALAEEAATYLRAVGVEEGVKVTILRRAPLGGPLHVRTSSGAELALDRELARWIEVTR